MRKKIFLYTFFWTVLFFAVSFITEKGFAGEIRSEAGYVTSKIAYFIFLYFSINFLVNFIFNIKKNKKWAINFLWFFVPLSIWLIVTWPGIYTWDEFFVYESATHFLIENWQSYFTSYFYIVCMYLFPSAGMIPFVQIIIMSFVSSWVITHLEEKFKIKKIKYIIIIFTVCWPAIVFSTLITFRSTLLAVFELWLVAYIYFVKPDEKIRIQSLYIIGFLTIILSVWRTEGIYHLIIIPIYLLTSYGKKNIKVIIQFTITIFLCTFILQNAYDFVKNDEFDKMRYELTAYMNPISIILSDKNVNLENIDLDKINKVINVENTKKNPSYYETPSFWSDGVQPNFNKSDFKEFKKEYMKLVLKNPDIFVGARTRTFVAASGFSLTGYYISDYIDAYLNKEADNQSVALMMSKELNNPIHNELRHQVINYLNMTKNSIGLINGIILFWNFIPLVVCLLFILIRIRSWKEPLLFMILLCILRLPLLFLVEPGSYFMYYYPLYLASGFIIIVYTLEYFEKKVKNDSLY